jgi:hypothetical protein
MLCVLLYGFETWSLRVLENMVFRGIFGPKRDGVTGEWRNYIMRNSMICTAVLVCTEFWWGKSPLRRPTYRWKDNIKMDLQEVRSGVWTGLSWLRIERWRCVR